MEDVLDVYQLEYDATRPVVCFDETRVQPGHRLQQAGERVVALHRVAAGEAEIQPVVVGEEDRVHREFQGAEARLGAVRLRCSPARAWRATGGRS